MNRTIDNFIKNHFETTNKSLLLTGARQVGKMTMFIHREAIKEPMIFKIDLSGLT